MIYLVIIISLLTIIYVVSMVYVIYGFLGLRKSANIEEVRTVTDQKISVIIPVRNEQENIIDCLTSLENQQIDLSNFEIIVVNDHSTDMTLEIVKEFIDNSVMDVSFYNLIDTTSKKEALKYGVTKTKYSIVATTDADCVVPNRWLSIIAANINESTNMLLGPVIFSLNRGFFYAFQTLDMMAIQGIEFGTLYHKNPILNNAANLAYQKSVYDELEGYDLHNTPSGDDIFLLEKFKKSAKGAIKGVMLSEFIVQTKMQTSIRDFWNQRLRWASKSQYYKDKSLLYFSTLILLQNMAQLTVYWGVLFSEKHQIYFLILLLSKWLIDFILLFLVSSFFGRKRSLLYFIPIQIVYPIYILIVGIASKFMKFEWKERRFNG